MRKLIVFVVIAALLYSGYWFVGRGQVEGRLTEMLDEISAGPIDLSYSDLRTIGFPSRFDTTISDLELSDPVSGSGWSAPFFQVFALSYRPNEVIAVFPPEQRFTIEGATYDLLTQDMRASGKVGANTSLDFRTATITMDNPRLRDEAGNELAMANLLAAMRLAPETEKSYDIFIEAQSIVLPEATRRFIDPGGLQPAIVQDVRLDSRATLSAPLALNSAENAGPEVVQLSVTEFAASWGEISLTAIGDVAPNSEGILEGSVTFVATNWERAIDLGVANGIVDADRRFLVTAIAEAQNETPDFADTLTITLVLADGEMRLGTLPLGPAPVLP